MTASQEFSAWVTCPIPNPHAHLRLFCFPYAGGGASLYRAWPENMPREIEVCPIQLPGREQRFSEPRFTHIEPLVEALGASIEPFLTMPFAFFGHSLGAIVSFELARYLRRQGLPLPEHLFVSAHRAPQVPDRHIPIHHLPDKEFMKELSLLKGMPDEVMANDDLLELMSPLLRADFGMAEMYAYAAEPPLTCPISAFGGLQDNGITREDMDAWKLQTTDVFTLHMVPGDHFFFVKDRHTLIRAIVQDLRRTQVK